ncbi:helix-turn-helix domain-containing protein [Fusobacterium varium]|uniref:helix-turn-helix domain-containing protein n=1 Tax=Fusobacterium varium TaxID=856 RepID=UPI001F2DDFC5|nr:helix-turn-helix transcriptional regulator [Fusobacterium varium]MCF2673350.1 helix-turn-helix domain-containing protein [Fusobacterium varium]
MEDNFKDRLVLLRKEKGLTQDALAENLSVAKSTISMYEKGNRMPSYKMIEKIADFFNVDIDYLMAKSNVKRKEEIEKYFIKDHSISRKQMELANRIRNKRLELGYSLEYVSEKTGIPKITLSKYESLEIPTIPSDKIEKLAETYEVSPAYIMGWEKNNSKNNLETDDIITTYNLTPEELLEYNKIKDVNRALFFNKNQGTDEDKQELDETLKKIFIKSLLKKREEEKNNK